MRSPGRRLLICRLSIQRDVFLEILVTCARQQLLMVRKMSVKTRQQRFAALWNLQTSFAHLAPIVVLIRSLPPNGPEEIVSALRNFQTFVAQVVIGVVC